MFDFKLAVHSEKLPDCAAEAVLLRELAESVDFYDDCPPETGTAVSA